VCVCVCVCVYVCVCVCTYVSLHVLCVQACMHFLFTDLCTHTHTCGYTGKTSLFFWYWITKAYDFTCATGTNVLMSGVTLNFTSVPNLLSTICARNCVSNSNWVPVFRCLSQHKQIRTVVGVSNEYSQALKGHKVFEMEGLSNSVAADYSNITHLTDSFKDLWAGFA